MDVDRECKNICVNGDVELDIPRDRNGSFEPKLVRKGERQLNGFDERIIALYARGMTTRDIQVYLEEAYGVEVSPTFISQVTNAVMDEVKAWQHRIFSVHRNGLAAGSCLRITPALFTSTAELDTLLHALT